MKVSKQRRKARSLFKRGLQLHRWPDGSIFWAPATAADGVGASVGVVFIRGREFTRPQCARQKDG